MPERRKPYREEHLALANACPSLVLAGAFDPPSADCDDQSKVDAFAQNDPYVKHGLTSASVRGAVGAVKMMLGRRAACVLQRVPVRLFASEGTAMGSLLTCEEVAKLRNSMRGNIALLDTREPKVVKEKPFLGDDVCHWYARELSDKLPEEYEPNALDDAVPKMLFPKNKKVVVFSTHGFRSMIVCLHLKHHGWTDVCNMSGGSASYEEVVGQKPRQDTDGGRDDEYISDDEDNKRA